MSVRYGVGLGSSGPCAARFVARALAVLEEQQGWTTLAKSRRYLSPAAGGVTLAPFVNAALLLETALPARALLSSLRACERRAGRVRGRKNAGRAIDLDLLWSSALPLEGPELSVPHQRLYKRPFALVPLLECFARAASPLPLPLLQAARRTAPAILTPLRV